MTTRRTVLITGGLGDIGRGLAWEFARQGTNIALCDLRDDDEGRAFCSKLATSGVGAFYRRIDVTRAEEIAGFVDETVSAFGGLDICIVNAGIVERGDLVDFPPEQWRCVLDVNLTGAFFTAQAGARAMLASDRGGHILFTGSWLQDQPRTRIGAYCASKSGLKMLAKCLALELAEKNVRVNVIAPGWVDAGLTAKNLAANPHLRIDMEDQIPLGRLMSVDELSRAVRLLCSDDAGYVTGTTFLVDGGASLIRRKLAPSCTPDED